MADADEVLEELAASLGSDDMQQVTAAVWNVFDLGERLADALTWQEGVDCLEAMAAAQSCRLALRYLPAPSSGHPAATLRPDRDAVARCAVLLERAARLLQEPADARVQPDASAQQSAGEHAAAAHEAFAAIAGRMTA